MKAEQNEQENIRRVPVKVAFQPPPMNGSIALDAAIGKGRAFGRDHIFARVPNACCRRRSAFEHALEENRLASRADPGIVEAQDIAGRKGAAAFGASNGVCAERGSRRLEGRVHSRLLERRVWLPIGHTLAPDQGARQHPAAKDKILKLFIRNRPELPIRFDIKPVHAGTG